MQPIIKEIRLLFKLSTEPNWNKYVYMRVRLYAR